MSCKVGNQTNSQDPQAVNSRVFVGNLNTFQCSKTDVERMFQRYGRIAGISMHKGYAFIQFTNPFDARSACLGEDGRLLWGQTLDVNMVAEPKAHQTGRKRQNIAKTGNDWDYYYDSYYAQVGFPNSFPTPRLVPPMKRARLHVPPTATPRPVAKPSSPNKPYPSNNTSLADLKSYSTPDILICGNCREMFSEIEQLMEHKKTYCKLRFTCKCHMLNGCKPQTLGEEPASLLCSQCKDSFHSAWDLMVHVQAAHMLNIYQLSSTDNMVSTNCNNITTNTIRDLHESKLEENGSGEGGVSMSTSTMGMMGNGDGLEDSASSLSLLHSHHSHSQHPSSHNSYVHLHNNNNCPGTTTISSHPHMQHQHQQISASSTSSSTSSMTSTIGMDGHSPCGHAENLNEILMESSGTPERQMNGSIGVSNSAPTFTNATTITNPQTQTTQPAAFPMEASTQTLHSGPDTDSPTNFDEHCGLLSAMKAEGMTMNSSKQHVPFTNGQPVGV